MAKKIVLCMIVKNEAHVIERCLASTLPVVDTWCIVDTGSTDGTQEKIKNFFQQVGIDGQLHERPWVHFGANRTEALELARPMGDYTLMIDADEILEFEGNFNPDTFKSTLDKDIYNVYALYGGIKYFRPQLTSNYKKFGYKGILHEYVECLAPDKIESSDFAKGFINRPIQDGARSKSADKYAKDAETFEEALKGTVDPQDVNRYHFYLAQSYRDSQQWQKAHDAYLKRAELGGWNEEVFYSLFQAGRIKEILNQSVDEIIKTYFQAYQVAPWRAESLWAAARLCRMYSRFDQGYVFAKHAVEIKYPEGGLFVTDPVYQWSALDEFAILGFWSGHYKEAVLAGQKLLSQKLFPEDQRQRIEANYKFCVDSLLTK